MDVSGLTEIERQRILNMRYGLKAKPKRAADVSIDEDNDEDDDFDNIDFSKL